MGTATTPATGMSVGSLKVSQLDGMYVAGPGTVALSPQSITANSSGAPHENRQPYQVANYIIAYNGIFPSQN